jgi:NodT family efflux transporter outer membrane factor (OMF) lipoprotein
MVGPKYTQAPPVPMTPAYKEMPPDTFKETKDWKQAGGTSNVPPGKWWEIFGDPKLNSLEEQVAAANQDLKGAEARYREARAIVSLTRAGRFPTISTGPGISSVRNSAHQAYAAPNPGPTGEMVLPFDLSYELDLWGRVRRSVTAAREEAQASAADLATATLSLQAEVAFDYFELRAADAQKKLLDDTVKAYSDAVELTKNRFEGGAAPKSDLAQARTQLDATLVQDTDVSVQRAAFEHAIAVLIGQPPAAFNIAPEPLDLEPPAIPVGVPSQLLERRPDIAAAERRVAEANERMGIAQAAFYPTVTLGAAVGLAGSSLLNWFTWPSRFWAVGPSMAQTLFDAGRRRAASEASIADYDATVALYRQATLTAFQQVEDNLSALRILDDESRQQRQAVEDAHEALRIFTNRYKGGVDNYLQVITAQTAALQNERNQVDILRRRMGSSVLLVKALGGGWDTSSLPRMTELR